MPADSHIIYAMLQACQPTYMHPRSSVPANSHIKYACSSMSADIYAPLLQVCSRWPYNICMLQACQPTYSLSLQACPPWSYNICMLQACQLISRPLLHLSHYPTPTHALFHNHNQVEHVQPTPQLFPHGAIPTMVSEGYYCDNHLSINPTTTKYFQHPPVQTSWQLNPYRYVCVMVGDNCLTLLPTLLGPG